MNTRFEVSYKTTDPKNGNAPSVSIIGKLIEEYKISYFIEGIENPILQTTCRTNHTIIPNLRQYFTPWIICIQDSRDEIVYTHRFLDHIENNTIFIKIDAFALGDNIAWIPYIEEFRKKYKCNVICSTFWNDLFVKNYPNILFVDPNIQINNVYAQYYIGASTELNTIYNPYNVNTIPLQKAASSALGLDFKEIRPDLSYPYEHIDRRIKGKYVCISEFGSFEGKQWKEDNGWQLIVDELNSLDFSVVVISKEPTNLKNVIDLTGNHSIHDRIIDLIHAEFYIGISSGLSWLAWAVNTKVLMISDVTPKFHEFQSNIVRLGGDNLSEVDYTEKSVTSIEKVLSAIHQMI